MVACLLTALIFPSCNTSKRLADNEYLLIENQVAFYVKKPRKKDFLATTTLESVLKQQPNTRYLGIKREWLYQKAVKRKEGGWLKKWMSNQSQPPAVYDSIKTQESMASLKNYLFNRGYFDAEVTHKPEIKRKKITSIFKINAGKPYRINSIKYIAEDPNVEALVDSLRRTSLMKVKNVIDDGQYQLERARITNAFLNKGYADFYSNLISPLILDTTGRENHIELKIYLPQGQDHHQKIRIGSVTVFTDHRPGAKVDNQNQEIVEGLVFKYQGKSPYVKTDILADKLVLRPGLVARKDDFQNSYRGLGDLGVYKFISITPKRDSLNKNIVNYDVLLTPNKKWVFDAGLDLNYSTLRTDNLGRNLFGVTGSVSLENRNLFNKGISFVTTAELGAEINLAQIDSFNTFSTSVETLLKIPKYSEFTGTLSFLGLMKLGKKNVLNPTFYKALKERSSTQIKLNYQNVFVTDFYRYQSLSFSYGYDLAMNKRKRYTINTFGINYYRPDTLSRFNEITRDAEFVLRSFVGDRLFTGFVYRDLSFYYQSRVKSSGTYWNISAFNEVSGIEIWGANSLYNAITNKQGKFRFKLDKEIDFAQYTKFDVQFRWHKPLPNNQQISFRLNPGVAFSLDTQSVPYIKQFFVGGPQSLRAWNIREVGPGANQVSVGLDPTKPYFSQGDAKLEINLEYRFDLFWRLKSAIFLDAGNVWLFDAENEEGNLDWDFYKDLAVGTGLGLRLDLSFVLFRFDLGYKLKTPYKADNGSYWYHNADNPLRWDNSFKNINYNLAIGYPF